MKELLIILVIVTGLAYLSQKESMKITNGDGRKHWDIYLIFLFIFLILFAGLRTSYNDTQNYIAGFKNSVGFQEFLANPENINLLNNPLFYGFQSLIRSFTDNVNVFFIICAIIVNVLNVRFIKRYTDIDNFAFSMFLYVALGTLMLSIAAQKQTLAMSVLTLAISSLINQKYFKYFFIVFIAGCIHSYAWFFLFFPLLGKKVWSFRTFLLLLFTVGIMSTFQSTIETFMSVADQAGKNIPVEEVFDGNRMNLFRVAVYSIVPLTALLFRKRIQATLDRRYSIFLQMSIVCMIFMLLGTMNGANMFGRSANYFEMGIICSMPWLIKQLFTKQSVMIVSMTASICFISFYLYDNSGFDVNYSYKSPYEFIVELIKEV